jgi:hypothetical protein
MRADSLNSHVPGPQNGHSVQLRGPGQSVVVRGKAKRPLTRAQYDVIKALLEAGPAGLTKGQLDDKSGHSEAHKILKRLHNSDPDWEAVIQLPGQPWVGYRIACDAGATTDAH